MHWGLGYTTFGTGGKVLPDLGGNDAAYAVAVQPDGRIVVGGTTAGDLAMVRYNANGTLDTTFGTAGVVRRDVGGPNDVIRAIAIQPDDAIVIAGEVPGQAGRLGVLGVQSWAGRAR